MIRLEHVVKAYGSAGNPIRALDDVNVTIADGQLVVVLGPSGCGKTTLLNIIGALDTPTSGRVVLADRELTAASRRELADVRRSTVCFVFQSFNLFPGLTTLENVQFGIDAAGRDAGPTEAAEILASVGLADRLSQFPHQLSGGEQQRVAVARALATANPILLADEPTGELDFHTGIRILELLRAHVGSGRLVLLVTHNREIARCADRVIELSGGRIVGDGPPAGGKVDVDDLAW